MEAANQLCFTVQAMKMLWNNISFRVIKPKVDKTAV